MRKMYLVCFSALLLFYNASGQSILNPNDSVITYNAFSPPAQPAWGQIGKWVRTVHLGWNTSEYKCYFYDGYAFRLHFPKTYNPSANDGKKYPMLIFFHGLGEADTSIYDNELQLYHGGDVFKAAVDNGTFDGYVLAMQSPGFWGNSEYQAIAGIIDYMIANNKLDPFNITANGLSAGGQGTWEMFFSHPTYIAGLIPMSSISETYSNADTITKVKFTPVWDMQGGVDGSPAPYTAQQVYSAMSSAGADFTYTEFPTLGHDTWDSTWALPDFYPFLLRAYAANPWALFGKTAFCPGDAINTTLGLAPGFQAYQWRRNGTVISGATSRSLQVTSTGTYDARVERNGIWSDWSRIPAQVIVQTSVPTPPIQVVGLMSTAIPSTDGKNFVTLGVSGSATYTKYAWKKVGSDSIYSTQSTLKVTQPGYYIVNALPAGACNSSYSPAFKVIDANGPNAPNPVRSLTANPISNTKILLSWSPSVNQANSPFAFEIYRSTDSTSYTFIKQVSKSVISFKDSALLPKTKYFYVLRAVDSTGASRLSNVVSSATYSDTTAPSIPASLKITYTTPSAISIAWLASTDNVSVDHYNIYVNNNLTNSTQRTSFTLTSLNQNQPYAIFIKAVDENGNISGASNQLSQEPVLGGLQFSYYKSPIPYKVIPDFLSTTPNSTGVSSNLDLNVGSQHTLCGYLWQGYIKIPVSGTYNFQLTSRDGSAFWFNSFTPAGAQTINNDSTHKIQTRKASIQIAAGIYPVCVEYFHNKDSGVLNLTWSCTALFGNSIQRPVADSFFTRQSVHVGSTPALPTNLKGTTVNYSSIHLTWTDNSSNETGFELYRSTTLASNYKIVTTLKTNTVAYTDSGLSAAKTYYYKIQAINQYGNSGLTAAVSANTAALPPLLAAPGNFKATASTSSKISLSWSNVTNNRGYQLLRSIQDSSNFVLIAMLAPGATSYSDTNLNANLTHYYKINALAADGVYGYSSVAFAKTGDNAPVMTALGTIKVPYGKTTVVNLAATDPDGDIITFTAKKIPTFAKVQNTNNGGTLTVTPTQSNLGTYSNLNILATDPYGKKDSSVFTLIVNNNAVPTIDSIANYTMNENDSKTITITAHDANNDVLKWSVANLPNAYTLKANSNNTATLTLHPNYLAAGIYNASITVDDGNGGIATRQFTITVNNVNPNTNIYVRFKDVDTIGAPWNNITKVTTTNLADVTGQATNIGLALQTTWFATSNGGATTGNNTGIYPDAVLKDYYYFGYFGGPETVTARVTGLDTSRLYNLTFFASSNFSGVTNNGSTIYTIGTKSDTLAVQNNTKNTAVFSNLKPASNGTITYTMSKNTDAQVGYINALVISSLYNDGTLPVAPTNLSAQNGSGSNVQLSWTDNAYNETGYRIYRALSSNQVYALIGQTQPEATGFMDTTSVGNTKYLYKILAFNSKGNSAYSNIVSIITNNRIPILNAISDVLMKSNQKDTISIKANDDASDHIKLSVVGLPSFASLSDAGNGTGKIIVTPAINNVGNFLLKVVATDSHNASDTTIFNLVVSDPSIASVYISFSDGAKPLPKPWNFVGPYPIAGTTFNNFKDDGNNSTPINLKIVNGFQGVVESGMQPVEGVGIYPNIIMRNAFYEGRTNTKDTIQLTGLSRAKYYTFVFFNSHDDGLNGTTNFTINANTVTLNATANLNKTILISNIAPDATGKINIIVSKAANADYAFISSMIIQAIDTSFKNTAPINLTTNNVTRNSISLIWNGRGLNETGYQIWRAIDGASSYSLIATVPVSVQSYTNTNLVSNKKYSYAIRGVYGTSYSNFSNSVSATTYAYKVYVNFTATNDAGSPWNNLNAIPQNGYGWNNFFDETGMITGAGMQLNTDWAGLYSAGLDSTNGIFPDTVMIDSYGLFPGQTATFKVTGLNLGMKYDFSFFASSSAYGDVNVAYTINGVTTLLNASLNINGIQTIYGVTADEYGNVTITVAPGTPGSQFGLIGALVINGYTPSTSVIKPTLPQSPQNAVSSNQSLISSNTISPADQISIAAFPNPFHDYLNLSITSTSNTGKIIVLMYDENGRLVYNNQFSSIDHTNNSYKIITNGQLAPGLYTLVVIDDQTKKMRSIKLIKR